MSKYTEAEKYIEVLTLLGIAVLDTSEEEKAIDTVREALEIADKVEQAITDEQTADCIIVDTECVNDKHDKEVWLNGYNQALSDVRGEENGK